MKTIDRRLSDLEQRARAVLRCEWCRYALRRVRGPQQIPPGADPADYVTEVCPWCGTRAVFSIGSLDRRTRDCLLLSYTKESGERFRDARVYAAGSWRAYFLAARSWLKSYHVAVAPHLPRERIVQAVHARGLAGGQTPAPAPNVWTRKERKLAEAERDETAALKERGLRFIGRMRAEEKRKYGPHTFPLAGEIKTLLAEPYEPSKLPGGYPEIGPGERDARRALQLCRAAELCELALWGETQTETREALAELAPAVEAFDGARAAKVREQEERKRREEEERQRREDERRARLASPKPPARNDDAFWLRDYAPPEPEAQPTRVRFRTGPVSENPLTPKELRERVVERCGADEMLRWANELFFDNALNAYDSEKLMNLANVPEEERRRRGFSWADAAISSVVVPDVR